MSSRLQKRLKRAERHLQIEQPMEIILVWDAKDSPPPGPDTIIITWEDRAHEP